MNESDCTIVQLVEAGVLAVVTDAFVQSLKLGFEEILTMSRIIFGGSRERSQI